MDAEGVHVTEAERIGSVAQTVSYPLEGDDADECSTHMLLESIPGSTLADWAAICLKS